MFQDELTLPDIMNNKYKQAYTNTPIYVTGGFIFKLVYKAYGDEGILKLFTCGRANLEFHSIIEDLFNMKYENFDSWIIQELKNHSKGLKN